MVKSIGEEVVVGEGGEKGVPSDRVSVESLIEQLTGRRDRATFGVGGDEVV